jgi:hypothetical protein
LGACPGSLSVFAADFQVRPVESQKGLGQRKLQPRSFVVAGIDITDLTEGLHNFFDVFGFNADPGVFDD